MVLTDCAGHGDHSIHQCSTRWNMPHRRRPILFGGSLIALEKKSGGVRPIVIGYTWRRLAAKCAISYAIPELADLFSPIQLGVGVPGGCEAAVLAARRYAEHMPDDHVIVNLDFSNAFNSLHRDAMLKAVADRVPSIYKSCHLSYSQRSILKFNNHRIMSGRFPRRTLLLQRHSLAPQRDEGRPR